MSPMLQTQFRYCTLTIALRFYSVHCLRHVSYNYAELYLGCGYRILPITITIINLYLFSADSYNNKNNNMLCNHVINYEVKVASVTDEQV